MPDLSNLCMIALHVYTVMAYVAVLAVIEFLSTEKLGNVSL